MMRITDTWETTNPTGVEWDDTDCPLCGERDEKLLLEATDPNPGKQRALRWCSASVAR